MGLKKKAADKPRKKINWKNNRKLRIGATATGITAAVTVAIVLLNVVVGILNDRYPLSWDLTAKKDFTLSEESEAVAEKVTKDVEITMFGQESTYASSSDTLQRQFYEFTRAYETLTDGKVKTVYVDLNANPELKSVYAEYNITSEGSILFRCGEQWRAITWEDMYETDYDNYYSTGATTTTSLVEQKLAANINAVSGERTVYLTFLTGHGEADGHISYLQDMYELNGYMTETVDFSSSTAIHKDSGALFIVAPLNDYTENEITRLREWLHNDGKRERDLFVYCDPSAAGKCPNLYEFLSTDFGLTVTDNLVVETDANNLLSGQNYGDAYILSQMNATDLTGDVIATEKIVMPETLQILTNGQTDTAEYALTTTPVVTFPDTARLQKSGEVGEAQKADEYPIVGAAYAYEYEYEGTTRHETYVFVCGNYLSINFSQYSQFQNKDFVLEPVRKTSSLGDTVVIQGKDLVTAAVSFSSAATFIIGRVIFSYGLPLLMLILSIVVFVKRRHL
ncbi:MAG: GldG family protein [Clostridia bacterium]|nr:GldG family protein [Clostridia bacterium]